MATQMTNVVDLVASAVAGVTATPAAPAVAVQTTAITFQGVTVDVERLADDPKTKGDDWHLSATLTYITTSPTPITYSEKFTGTYDQAITRASAVVRELATLKVAHDAVHIRINDLSAGKP